MARLTAGETPDAVEADITRRFGPQIRAVPGFSGIGLIAWIAPALLGACGLLWLVLVVRPAVNASVTAVGQEDGDEQRADERLRDRVQDALDDLD